MCSSLPAIEVLLHEFYQPTTPNSRKRQIETELISFKSQSEAWQPCLRIACAPFDNNNQYLWFFATSTLEYAITRRWTQLAASERAILRQHLWNTYAQLAIDGSVPRRQRDTLAQLIAQMGKREFPDDHPQYVLHCCELIKTRFPLGICLLRTTSEEVVSQREDCTTDRKNYFHSCMSMCIPDVMDLVTKYLLIAVCHINGKDIHSIQNNLMDYTLITSLPNDNQLSSSLLELLTCLQHLVSWVRTEVISEYFLLSILDLTQWRTTASAESNNAHQDISLAALSVLNELLYLQKLLPHARTLMSGVNMMLEQYNATTKQQSEIYVDKFRELLRLYAGKYANKLIQENELLEGFLKPLYGCTIHKNGALDFTEKLEIWTPLIKGLKLYGKMNRYNDIVHQLVAEIMRRTQFEFNKAELELLDNEAVEDNTQTEWQQFLTQCIECVALVAESRPNAVFAQVFAQWSRPHVYILSIECDIDSGKEYELERKLKCSSFTEHLRDYATVCQAVIRIAPMLDARNPDVAAEVNNQYVLLAENLFATLKFFASNKLARLAIDKSAFQSDLDNLYAHVLTSFRNILPICQASLKSKEFLWTLLDTLGSIFLPDNVTATIVYLAAGELFFCISYLVRPKFFLEIPSVLNLMQAGPRLTHLPRHANANIYISLISYLALPCKNGGVDDPQAQDALQQDFQSRCALLCEYIQSLAQPFLQLDLNTEPTKVLTIATQLLGTFSLAIEFFADSSRTTKDLLAVGFKPVITKALMFYNNFGATNNSIAIIVAEFSLSILRTLQNQLGPQFTKEMLTLFVSVRSSEPLSTDRLDVLERILQMFQLIVEQPGNASISLLPSILDFAIEQILPLLQQTHNDSNSSSCSSSRNIIEKSDLSNLLYELFDSVLTCKWQYFYKSHVQHNGSLLLSQPNSAATEASSDNMHPEHFMAIMNSYGQILVTGNDPSIVRTVLTSLQSVNDRWRLYQRTLFKDTLLASFQSALIKVLLSGEGALHFELLANALYAMGQVDTLKMRESFATAGFPVNLKVIDEICLASDIPTFSQKLSQLIQDTHCVHLAQT